MPTTEVPAPVPESGAIVLTRLDRRRLQALIDALRVRPGHDATLDVLQLELDLATIVEPREILPTVITINTRVQVVDQESGERLELTVVLPPAARPASGRVSVLGAQGMALLGARVGEEISWPKGRTRQRMRVERVLYQPEAAEHGSRMP